MARHRRYQSKKHHGYSRGTPNSKKRGNDENFKKNQEDDQPVPRSIKDLQKSIQEAKTAPIKRKKSHPRNRLLEESAKLGYAQRPWENPERLFERVERDTRKFVREEIIKARYGLAGRDEREIAKDYKELDEKEKRKKLQRIAEQEKQKKLQEKEEKWKKTAKKIDHPDGYFTNENIEAEDDEEEMLPEDAKMEGSDEEEKDEPTPKKKSKKSKETKKRLGKNDKLKMKKKQINDEVEKDMILNAREIIPFGERADEPPQLPKLSKKIQMPDTKAGSRNLLLKQLLDQPKDDDKIQDLGKSSKKVSDDERQRIIDLYRKNKPKNDGVSL